MANTSSITSDIVVTAHVVTADDDKTLLEFRTKNEHNLMKGAHNVQIVPSLDLDVLNNGPYNTITLGNYLIEFNETHTSGASLLFAKDDQIKVSGSVFRLKVWNYKKHALAHHEPEPVVEEPVAECLGSEPGEAPSSPKKQKLDEHRQD